MAYSANKALYWSSTAGSPNLRPRRAKSEAIGFGPNPRRPDLGLTPFPKSVAASVWADDSSGIALRWRFSVRLLGAGRGYNRSGDLDHQRCDPVLWVPVQRYERSRTACAQDHQQSPASTSRACRRGRIPHRQQPRPGEQLLARSAEQVVMLVDA